MTERGDLGVTASNKQINFLQHAKTLVNQKRPRGRRYFRKFSLRERLRCGCTQTHEKTARLVFPGMSGKMAV
jgi:hypothetical protein